MQWWSKEDLYLRFNLQFVRYKFYFMEFIRSPCILKKDLSLWTCHSVNFILFETIIIFNKLMFSNTNYKMAYSQKFIKDCSRKHLSKQRIDLLVIWVEWFILQERHDDKLLLEKRFILLSSGSVETRFCGNRWRNKSFFLL